MSENGDEYTGRVVRCISPNPGSAWMLDQQFVVVACRLSQNQALGPFLLSVKTLGGSKIRGSFFSSRFVFAHATNTGEEDDA